MIRRVPLNRGVPPLWPKPEPVTIRYIKKRRKKAKRKKR